jgi:hypothetical protein
MSLQEQISQSLPGLRGQAFPVPKTVGWAVDGGPTLEIDFTAVETLSCAFRELRMSADELKSAPLQALKAWADRLCQRVTYLLEQIGPIEADDQDNTILVRSTPPATESARISFYEMLVNGQGTVNLRRYTRDARDGDRRQVDIQITNEVLQRLVRDIVAALPAVTAG